MTGSLRAVIDTNVLISALLFRNGRLRNLRQAWQAGQFQPIVSAATSSELVRVLHYKKFKLDASEIQEALALYIPYVETHVIKASAKSLKQVPICRDPKDQMFLNLAQSAQADFLISGDEDLLSLDDPAMKQLCFRVVTPQTLLAKLNLL